MDLPEQLSDLTRRLHALQEDVTIESKRIDGKADYAVVDDKVTRAVKLSRARERKQRNPRGLTQLPDEASPERAG